MGIIQMIVVGLIVGLIARAIMPGEQKIGLVLTTLLGIAGAAIANFLGSEVGWYQQGDAAGWIASIIGALLTRGRESGSLAAQLHRGQNVAMGLMVVLSFLAAQWAFGDFDGVEKPIYLHSTKDLTGCPAGPAGSDLPGGFGWLEESGCSATVDGQGWIGDDTGVDVSKDCKTALENIMGSPPVGGLILMPIFVETNGLSGSNGEYRIDGFGAFYLTGYRLPGANQSSVASGTHLCKGSDMCLYGWFTEALVPVGSLTGGGSGATPRGATVVDLIG